MYIYTYVYKNKLEGSSRFSYYYIVYVSALCRTCVILSHCICGPLMVMTPRPIAPMHNIYSL
jgi:hypothetical protein